MGEAFARGGFQTASKGPYPEASSGVTMLLQEFEYNIEYVVLFVFVLAITWCLCCQPGPTEEQKARRKAFEEKMASYEKRLEEMKQKEAQQEAAASEESKPIEEKKE